MTEFEKKKIYMGEDGLWHMRAIAADELKENQLNEDWDEITGTSKMWNVNIERKLLN